MKKNYILILVICVFSGVMTTESCKSKKDQPVPEQKTTAPVEINTDQELRTSVNAVLNDFKEVRADINNGVITLTGTIKQDELQKLIMRLQELKPKKVENQLVIK